VEVLTAPERDCPEVIEGVPTILQSSPAYPGLHTHIPSVVQIPFAEHCGLPGHTFVT